MKKHIGIIGIILVFGTLISCRENKESESSMANQIEESTYTTEPLPVEEENIDELDINAQEIEETATDESIEDNETTNEIEEKQTDELE